MQEKTSLPENFDTFLEKNHLLTPQVLEQMKLLPDTVWRFIRVPDGIYIGWGGSHYHLDLVPESLFSLASDGGYIAWERGKLVVSGSSSTLAQHGVSEAQQLKNRAYTEKLIAQMLTSKSM